MKCAVGNDRHPSYWPIDDQKNFWHFETLVSWLRLSHSWSRGAFFLTVPALGDKKSFRKHHGNTMLIAGTAYSNWITGNFSLAKISDQVNNSKAYINFSVHNGWATLSRPSHLQVHVRQRLFFIQLSAHRIAQTLASLALLFAGYWRLPTAKVDSRSRHFCEHSGCSLTITWCCVSTLIVSFGFWSYTIYSYTMRGANTRFLQPHSLCPA